MIIILSCLEGVVNFEFINVKLSYKFNNANSCNAKKGPM